MNTLSPYGHPVGDELQHEEAHRILDAALDHLPAMVFLKRASDLAFVRFNRAGEELLGLSAAELIGKTDYDFFPKEQADFFVQKDREVLGSNTLVDIPEEPIQTPRGTRWLHTRKIPLRDASGKPAYLLGISLDITEQREAFAIVSASHAEAVGARERTEKALVQVEEQLRQAQKMEAIGRLAGGIAHDFNNILSVILSTSELALEVMAPEDPVRADLEEIRRAGQRAADLTRQLLAFARRQILQPRVLELNAVVRGMERMLHRLLGEDIALTLTLAPTLGRVRADPSQIEQVVMNLVVNSRDAMPTGGRLTIETAPVDIDESYALGHFGATPGRYAMIAVSDTGCGMDRDTMSRIFEPFFTTKEKGHGTGLGLPTVLGIVQQSGGWVFPYSEPGEGTTFKIYLPVVDAPVSDAEGEQARPRGGGGETVLVVEDDAAVRKVAVVVLEQQGYRVLSALSADEAVSIARRHPVSLLLTDVVMPEVGGREVAARVKAVRPEMRVLFMSGYADDAVIRHGVLEPGIAFLQKPLTPKRLLERVRTVLDQA